MYKHDVLNKWIDEQTESGQGGKTWNYVSCSISIAAIAAEIEVSMNQKKADAIVGRLMANTAGLRYGCVAVSIKLHDGRVVQVLYSTTENIRDESQQGG